MLSKERVEALAQPAQGRVHASAYTDPAVFDAEMQALFHAGWVYVAHASELSNAGDFKTAHVGLAGVIVVRDEAGEVNVLVNMCPACASALVEAESGNSKTFYCPYHDWHFDNRGALAGVDFRMERANRVDSYRGLIFASFTDEGPSLSDHLGLAKQYLDDWSDQSPTGEVELSGGHWKHAYDGNWKLQQEAGVDGYRADYRRRQRGRGRRKPADETSSAKAIDLGNGHSLVEAPSGFDAAWRKHHPQAYVESLVQRLGSERTARVLGGGGWRLQVFPNLTLSATYLRVVRPIAVDRTEVLQYHVALPDVSDAQNTERLRDHQRRYGPAGSEGPDDLEMFARVHEGLRANEAEGLNPWALFSRGLTSEVRGPNGERFGDVTSEVTQRAIYYAWTALLQGQSHVTAREAAVPTAEAASITVLPVVPD